MGLQKNDRVTVILSEAKDPFQKTRDYAAI